jgi:hypothetical protein
MLKINLTFTFFWHNFDIASIYTTYTRLGVELFIINNLKGAGFFVNKKPKSNLFQTEALA